jgi:transcriptional regulator with XRE-family HTH domain
MWESNASLPAIRYVPAILSFLGYDPFPPAQTLGDRLISARKLLGLSQRKLALSLRVDPGTLQSWEAEQHKPTGRSVERVEGFLETFGDDLPTVGRDRAAKKPSQRC